MSSITLEECIYQILRQNGTPVLHNAKQFHSCLMDVSHGKLKDQTILGKLLDEQFFHCFSGNLSGTAPVNRATERAFRYLCDNFPVTDDWAMEVAESFRAAINRSMGYTAKTSRKPRSEHPKPSNRSSDTPKGPEGDQKKKDADRQQSATVFGESDPMIRTIIEKADHGDAKLQYQVANWYMSGKNVPRDIKKGMQYLNSSAQNGYAIAQKKLGKICYSGDNDTRPDKKRAVFWLEKAADQGDVDAQFDLGKMYFYGDGIPKDEVYGLNLIYLADMAGHKRAHELYQNLIDNMPRPKHQDSMDSSSKSCLNDTETQGNEPQDSSAKTDDRENVGKKLLKMWWLILMTGIVLWFLISSIISSTLSNRDLLMGRAKEQEIMTIHQIQEDPISAVMTDSVCCT